jgi:hypothetical protein
MEIVRVSVFLARVLCNDGIDISPPNENGTAAMSEYQHYEFQALDRPLTRDELSYVRSLSSRVELTPTRAVFEYSLGNFQTDPQELVERCFDAMLYQASFGIQRLMFRFPRSLLTPTLFAPYCISPFLTVSITPDHLILNINITEEEGLGWIRNDDWLTKLIPLRDELLRGDLRLLYLTWLIAAQVDPEGSDEDLTEPPVPANLGNLSPALEAFVDLFGLDEDLISAAAETSPIEDEEAEPIEVWVAQLPEPERNDFLVRVARGESHVGSQLVQRLRQLFNQPRSIQQAESGRSLADLMTIALTKEKLRKTREQQTSRQARLAQLEALAPKETNLWKDVFRLIELKQTRAYDQAIEYLIDLRDLAEQQGTLAQFVARVNKMQIDYGDRAELLTRIQQARLLRD